MKNKHVELVKKWLADKNSVSRDELVMNADAATTAYSVPYAAYAACAVEAAYAATTAYSVPYAAYAAANAVEAAYAADATAEAAYWVKKYEELTQ